MAELKCMPLKALVDAPLFGRDQGHLAILKNMRIRPGGYAEARGGMERLKPSGGTATAPIGAGGITGGLEVSTSFGWIRSFNKAAAVNSQYSDNSQFSIAPLLFPTGIVDDAIYFGADQPFNRIGILLSVAANWNVTIVYEYFNGTAGTEAVYNHANWVALTTTETVTWTVAGTTQYASWVLPTDWAHCNIGDSGTGFVERYWMRIRISARVAVTTLPNAYQMFGFWSGVRDFYIASSDPRSAVAGGLLRRWGQQGTTAWWQTVTNASALYSNPTAPHRMAAYRGRLFLVNGKDQKRWDGTYFSNIGLTVVASGFTSVVNVAAGMGAGIWRYYFAWGYGPCSVFTAQPVDPLSSYGVTKASLIVPTGGADPADANSTLTTAPNGTVTITLTPATIPPGASALYIYRTQDLTNVPITSRSTMPAFLITSLRVTGGAGVIEAAGVYTDTSTSSLFPPIEAVLYDNSPPTGAKYILVYQNRLFLGTDEAWYWSDPFLPDSFNNTFNYVILARALGGRNMGGAEYADQVVLFTEDQTWGLRSVELDVPQLYPIHPAIGCVAPDSVATGDGLIIWMGRDGFYAWDGGRKGPIKISEDLKTTFSKMSYEKHGKSRGIIHNRRYDIFLIDANGSAGVNYSYDLETGTWSRYIQGDSNFEFAPICNIHAPLGHADAGVPHPVFAKVNAVTGGGEDYNVYLGEYGMLDHLTAFECSATMHFPQPPSQMFSPNRILAYYQTDSGWDTPTLSVVTSNFIGSTTGTPVNVGTPDTGNDYSLIGGTFPQAPRGVSDIKLSFTANTVAGGSVGFQRFFGAILEGFPSKIRRGMV